jgi:acetolactate synthase-1/2/3 large subunit
MAWSCGADGYAVGRPDNLRSALAEALRRRRPAVIDVPMANEPARARSGLGY